MLQLLTLLCLQITLISPEPGRAGRDILPQEFGGWQAEKAEKYSWTGLAAFSPEDAGVLREYGFLAAERKQYTRNAGRITVEALHMRDSSGAYGIFTHYRQTDWRALEAPGGPDASKAFHAAVGPNQTVLLRNSYCLRILGAELPRRQLAALAAVLPTFREEPLPSVREFLPEKGVIQTSLKYVTGPRAFARLVPQIQPALMGFDMGAEAELAQYRLPGKPPMTLMLVLYPTPQIASARAKQFSALPNAALHSRRKGSLVSLVLDAPGESEANLLMDRVNYSMGVMWNQAISKERQPNLGELMLNIVRLSGILALFCLFSGLLHGGLRLLCKWFFPGRIFDRDMELVTLNLSR